MAKAKTTLASLSLLFFCSVLYATEADIIEREGWYYDDANTTKTGTPTNIQYFKYFDMLPDEIVLEIFNEKNLSHLQGRRVFVGYGTVDPTGSDCRVFPASTSGLDQDITVCLPWWRIERDYQPSTATINDLEQFLCTMPSPRPPLLVNICKDFAPVNDYYYPGGKVTCTSYYNRLLSAECWENPKQASCFVNNCSDYIQKNCTNVANVMGEKHTLETAKYATPGEDGNKEGPIAATTKIDVLTYQYQCPAGALVPNQKCVEEKTALMFPYECTPDNPNTRIDDGVYVYCDEDRPQYDLSGEIVGFLGRCPNGQAIMCEANTLRETKLECLAPTYTQKTTESLHEKHIIRDYVERSIDVLSGQPDVYAQNPNCVRANTVEDARDQEIFVRIKGNGYLDDDIHVLRHMQDGRHIKVYCNMQHNGGNNHRKAYNGEVLQCIGNNGSYSFDQTVKINATDIVSVQQATEHEDRDGTPFSGGRTHYSSSKVVIDDILVAPEVFGRNFPFYPNRSGQHLQLWENTLGTLSILFPYSGAYRIQFFNKNGDVVADKTIGLEDFEQVNKDGHLQLMLGKDMDLDAGMTEASACREDDWVEWGGGVYGGRDTKKGTSCASPNSSSTQNTAIYNVLIRDLLTGGITPMPLVYPIAYPNRIFLSKLNVYEKRKYRCYEDFPVASGE